MKPSIAARRWARRPVWKGAALAGATLMAFGAPSGHVLISTAAAPLWSLSGVVQTASGTRVPNAAVALSILPDHALSRTPTPTVYITQVTSGTDGSYTIPAPSLSPDALAQAARNSGWLNLEIDAAAISPDTEVAGANGDTTYYGGKALSVLVAPTVAGAGAVGTIRSAPNGTAITVYGFEGYAVNTSGASTTINNLEHKIPCFTQGCIANTSTSAINNQCGQDWYAIANESDYEPIGEMHTWDDMSGSFSYGQTASTNLGVAFNYNSGDGWNAGGTAYMGNSGSYTVGSGTVGADYGYQQDGQFAWEQDESDSGCQGRPIYRIIPLYWTGGFGQGSNVSGSDGPNNYWNVPSQYRADIQGGAPVDKENGTGYTYSWQVTAFGIGLSSETDYSSSVKMHWDMGTGGVQHSLFGYGAPPSDPNVQLVFASTE